MGRQHTSVDSLDHLGTASSGDGPGQGYRHARRTAVCVLQDSSSRNGTSGCGRLRSGICGECARKLLRVKRFRCSQQCSPGTVNPSRKLRRFESFTCHHVLKGPLTCGNAGQGLCDHPAGASKIAGACHRDGLNVRGLGTVIPGLRVRWVTNRPSCELHGCYGVWPCPRVHGNGAGPPVGCCRAGGILPGRPALTVSGMVWPLVKLRLDATHVNVVRDHACRAGEGRFTEAKPVV